MEATISVLPLFNGERMPGARIVTYTSGDRWSFFRAVEAALPRGLGWGMRFTIAEDEAEKLGAEFTQHDEVMIHLSQRDHERFPRLGQAVVVELFRVPADPFAAFDGAPEECR